MKFILLFFCYMLSVSVLSDETDTLTTISGTYSGKVTIDWINSRVTFRDGNSYANYSAKDVQDVVINSEEGLKKYTSGIFGLNDRWLIFEVLVDSKVKLLKREGVKFSDYDQNVFPPYFIKIGTSVYSIDDKKQLIEAMNDKSEEIKNYLKVNKFDAKNEQFLIAIFSFYQSLL